MISALSSRLNRLPCSIHPIESGDGKTNIRVAPIIQRTLGIGLLLALPSFAVPASTGASTYAFISGLPADQKEVSGGNGGAATSSNSNAGEGGDASASAAADLGSLRAGASSRASLPTQLLAQAKASWADGFTINALGHASSEQGTFSGSAMITGALLAEFTGLGYADTYVVANLFINSQTGFDGSIVSLQGGGRKSTGYDIGFTKSGSELFFLNFTDVPFVFGREISVAMSLFVVAEARTFSTATSHAEADYFHTMAWGGLSEVRDSSGKLLSDYSAISSTGSGFNFAAAAVPEPSSLVLLITGISLLGVRKRPLTMRA